VPRKTDNHLRIAMLGHKRVPSREGGVEIVVEELATRIVNLGHNVTCYNRRGHHVSGTDFDNNYKLKEYNGVKLKNVLTIDKRGLSAMTASFFAAIKAAFGRYDVVHFHAEGPCAMIWLTKLFRKKCVATIHGLDHQRAKWGKFASWYIRFGEKCAVKFADEIIVLSTNVQDYFLETYGRETVYIPNGVSKPNNLSADKITEKFGICNNEYILFLGRLVPEKGIKYLIDAFKSINTDKKLVIAGGSSDAYEFKSELLKLSVEDSRIIFTDFVDGDILCELLSNAYLYVLPSDLEGMPLSLLEAMSYGNCCLTSDIPECKEVINNFGLTFEKGNVIELTDKLEYLLENVEVVEYYKSISGDYICNKYNWDDVVERTLCLYGCKTENIKKITELNYENLTDK